MHHDIKQTPPELFLGCGLRLIQSRNEIAEQQTEKYQPEHLPVRGRGYDVRRHHADKHIREIACTSAIHLRQHAAGIGRQADHVAHRFTIRNTGL